MKIIYIIKSASAALLLLCFVLPFSSCTRNFDEQGKEVMFSNRKIYSSVTEYEYPFQWIKEPNDRIRIILFFWPIPILYFQKRINRKIYRAMFWVIESVILILSLGMAYLMPFDFTSSPAIGAHLMKTSYFIYGSALALEFFILITKKIRYNIRKYLLQRTA